MQSPAQKSDSRSADVQLNPSLTHTARPAKKPSWRSVCKRLNEIDALRRAAFARRDWPAVHSLDSDWHWVFRTGR